MKLLNREVLIMLLLVCVTPITMAQEVDEIIAKHIEAHGGADAWNAVQSMKISGRFAAFSVEEDFFALKTKGGAYYSELFLGQHKVIEAFDGQTGWTIDPWQDFVFPRELNKREVNVFQQKAEFFTPFYNYKEKGIEVELIGKQDVDGIDVFAIKLTRPDGNIETWYLDANTFLEYKYESNWVDFAYSAPAECYFDDFRTVKGLVIPYFIERTFFQRDRILQIENIDFNPKVDKNMFKMPRNEEMKRLSFLAGEWDVKVDVWSRRGNRWYTIDSTISEVGYTATNLLQEIICYERVFVQSKTINYSFNSETKIYRISVYNDFGSDIDIYEGNFTDSTFAVSNREISFGDSDENNSLYEIIFSNIAEDSFEINTKMSNDKGETWMPIEKLQYTRRE